MYLEITTEPSIVSSSNSTGCDFRLICLCVLTFHQIGFFQQWNQRWLRSAQVSQLSNIDVADGWAGRLVAMQIAMPIYSRTNTGMPSGGHQEWEMYTTGLEPPDKWIEPRPPHRPGAAIDDIWHSQFCSDWKYIIEAKSPTIRPVLHNILYHGTKYIHKCLGNLHLIAGLRAG